MNTQLKVGQFISVHGYKHNGDLYRRWDKSFVLEITSDYTVLVNANVIITEITGRKRLTYDPAIWFVFPNKWYNIICMLRDDGIHYYCNIATPFIYDQGVIKYIDYDLDIKVFPNRTYKLLDLKEFRQNSKRWGYSPRLQKVLWNNFNFLKYRITHSRSIFFDDKFVLKLWLKFEKNKNFQQNNNKKPFSTIINIKT